LRRALNETDVVGVACNLDLLGRIVAHPAFAAGGVDTGFIARHADTLLATERAPPTEVLAAAALSVLSDEAEAAVIAANASADPYSPWHARDHWWLNADTGRELPFVVGDASFAVVVRARGAAWELRIGDRVCTAAATRSADGRLDMVVDGVRECLSATHLGESIVVRRNGETFRFHLPDPMAAAAEEDEAGGRLVAPLPGQITQVAARPGLTVARGETLVVLEAMKTVFRLAAPTDGTIATVSCRVGDTVVEGQLLVAFAEDGAPAPD
jgi:3-methylcrotonyl-CoA carboxylase alpha subunit